MRIAKGAAIESRVTWVQVDETADLLGMAATDRAQFFAGDRVSNENRLSQVKRGDDGKNIVAETVGRIVLPIGRGVALLAEAAASNAINMVSAGEFRREVVEDMRRVPQTGEENERASAAAPIEHFKLDAELDGHELHSV